MNIHRFNHLAAFYKYIWPLHVGHKHRFVYNTVHYILVSSL